MIEMDEKYFRIESSEVEKAKVSRRHGTDSKSNVSIMAGSALLEDPKKGKVPA